MRNLYKHFFLFSIQFDTSVICKSCPQLYTPKQRSICAKFDSKRYDFDMLEYVYGNILARTGHCQQKIKPEMVFILRAHSPSFWQVYINIQLTTREQFTFQFICRVVRPEFSLFGLSIHCKIYNLRCHIPVQS